jgi:hypothetical protein
MEYSGILWITVKNCRLFQHALLSSLRLIQSSPALVSATSSPPWRQISQKVVLPRGQNLEPSVVKLDSHDLIQWTSVYNYVQFLDIQWTQWTGHRLSSWFLAMLWCVAWQGNARGHGRMDVSSDLLLGQSSCRGSPTWSAQRVWNFELAKRLKPLRSPGHLFAEQMLCMWHHDYIMWR